MYSVKAIIQYNIANIIEIDIWSKILKNWFSSNFYRGLVHHVDYDSTILGKTTI